MKWPDPLVLDLARRRVVLVLGAGISRNSQNSAGARPKLWSEFLSAALAASSAKKSFTATVKRMMREGDYLTACELIKSNMGNPAFHNFCRQQFLTPGFMPAKIHDSIIDLDSRIVATPNIDTIYENRVNAIQNSTVAVKNYTDSDVAEAIRQPGRVVIKIHGTINTPADMIFTRSEYARARNQHRSFYSILEALAITHTFLFLGCGLSDPDIRLLLEDYAFRYTHRAPHYFVTDDRSVPVSTRSAIGAALNVSFLCYKHTDDHGNLLVALSDLATAVNARRTGLTTAEW